MGKVNQKNRPYQSSKKINGKINKYSSPDKTLIQKRRSIDKPMLALGQLKKKDKFKNKRKNLINKIKLSEKQELIEIKRKRRQKNPLTGDLKQLKDALPSLDELFKLPRNDIKTGIKSFDDIGSTKLLKENKNDKNNRRKQFMNQYKCFTSLLNNKDFKNNPRDAIAYHIQNNIRDD